MPPNSHLLGELGALMNTRREAIIETMMAKIIEVDPKLSQTTINDLLRLSIAGNVQTMIDILCSRGLPEGIPEVPDAIAYAVAVAQTEVPAASLRRAYHTGSKVFLGEVFTEIEGMNLDSNDRFEFLHQMTSWVHEYVDNITREVMDAYDEQLKFAANRRADASLTQINILLESDDADVSHFEKATKYKVQQFHLGTVIWIAGASPAFDHLDRIGNIAEIIAPHLGATEKPLIAPVDRSTAQIWFGLNTGSPVIKTEKIRVLVKDFPKVRIAFGAPVFGRSGFRESIAQAHSISNIPNVTSTSTGKVVQFLDDGTWSVAQIVRDLEQAQRWVTGILGSLADKTEEAERNRETLQTFFDSNLSFSTAATKLMLHRNTVKYRIDRIEEILGQRVAGKQIDIRVALRACQLIGDAVLSK